MIHNPEVLILDEPTVGLDPNQIIEIRELIKSLAQQHTVILSTHILSEVSASCNRVVIINEGQIVAEDSVDNLENRTIGKPGWHISLKAPKELDWKDLIKKIDGAEIADEQESNGINNFNLKLSSKDDFDAFFSGLASKGAVFKEITPIKATLEDVFMEVEG